MSIKALVRTLIRRTRHGVRMGVELLRHPRTPWYVYLMAFLVVAYALSPIDLIPDFIPVLGYVDDLILLPLGIALVIFLTPADVRREALRSAAKHPKAAYGRGRWFAVAGVITIWLTCAAVIANSIVKGLIAR